MDPVRNPFAPGAGQRPPELAGRDREVDAFEIVLERVARGRPERSLVLTGLRGVGKTVLLGELRSMAIRAGWRMWLLDLVSHVAKPCFRQEENDSIGHEFWTQNGYIFFDNRGPGHDGTITSDRTQAVVKDVPVNDNTMIPFVGLIDRDGKLVRRIDLPYYCNHYHANPDNTLLVGDDIDDLVLVDISGAQATVQTLCTHKTSWHTQSSHCHPTWSWDGKRILYASDEAGRVNLFLIEF
jgi:hypothetical protein